MARVELGDLQVQGIDYAYTLHGWLKGVNSNTLDRSRDIGKDGDLITPLNPYKYFGGDVFGFSLGYFDGPQKDYTAISNPSQANHFLAKTSGSDLQTNRKDLYNGNISYMVTTLPDNNAYTTNQAITASTRGNAYTYDQLNRITSSTSFDNISTTNNEWLASGPPPSAYSSSYTYDAMGNIKTLNNSRSQVYRCPRLLRSFG